MKPEQYIFPAVFDYADDGITIDFPDLPGCMPCAFSTGEALHNASEAMSLHLYNMQRDGENIPEPSDIFKIKNSLEANQIVVPIAAYIH